MASKQWPFGVQNPIFNNKFYFQELRNASVNPGYMDGAINSIYFAVILKN
jgi:hypothetical protein